MQGRGAGALRLHHTLFSSLGPGTRSNARRSLPTSDDYDLPGFKTVEHVCVLGSERAAWFRDPEGNILCLHEDLG